jgi:hypothetical protein
MEMLLMVYVMVAIEILCLYFSFASVISFRLQMVERTTCRILFLFVQLVMSPSETKI